MSDIENIVETEPAVSKKRKRCPETWKRNVAKTSRHLPKSLPKKPNCKHKVPIFQCNALSMQDVRKIHEKYYQVPDLQWKKNYILQHVYVNTAKKRCVVEGLEGRKNLSTCFVLPKQRCQVIENIRVCRVAFLNILQEKRDRVNRLCQKFLESDPTPAETRGGDRKSLKYESRREAVKEFIKTFRPIQSYQTRGKHAKRQYLPSELSTKNCGHCTMKNVPVMIISL
ncbi:hypothetical protein ABEB36_012838 [Hypothenemus hampei]|uniref:Uncharacterized protein n=1 Tax=Hypothenemus hampei TaxID=57062 RepID=A0ABD1E826_HYPHA